MSIRWLAAAAVAFCALPARAEDAAALCRSEAERGQTAACERAIAASPKDAELHALLGQAYFASGFYPEGLQALKQAIRVSNGDPAYRYRFAGYAALVNEYPLAVKELTLATASTPDDVRLWVLLADCYRYMKNTQEALQASRRAAELGDPAESYVLAMHYGSGEGLPLDYAAELLWLERAAKSGHVSAMQSLARLYADGRPGIPPDPAKRQYWDAKVRRNAN